ncbi:MAG: efflux transporter outer membrane subunit [Parachlamydiaceae bacterium]|nr:efflux transporter outer membrane subunit [Parachlamydiaceae bacterium]
MQKILHLIFLLLLTGCIRVGPNFKSPPTNTQGAWTEQSPHIEINQDIDMGPWWQNFKDEMLNSLIDYALQENYSLEAAAYRILAAKANLGFAIGEFFPQTQQAEGSLIRKHISANAPNTLGIDRDFLDGILGLRVAWELDFWGRFYRGVQVAGGQYNATKDDYRDVQRILISDIVIAYVQHKTFQSRIAILKRNVAIQFRSSEIAKVRWEEGFESELDYAQAVTLWKETEAQKTSLEIELKRTLTSIAILVGLTPEEFTCHFTINSDPLNPPIDVVVGCPAEILYQRPDLRRSLDLLYAQNARVGIAVSDLFPRISFTGFLGLECGSDTHTTANQMGKHFFSRNSLTFFYGPDFAWPILNYGRLENRIKEQYALLNEGIATYRNQVLEAYKEVEDSLTFFVKSIEQTNDLKLSFKYAKRSVDISTLQYQEGLADYSRVLNSLQLQVAAEDAMAQALGNISLAYANIYRSLGTF